MIGEMVEEAELGPDGGLRISDQVLDVEAHGDHFHFSLDDQDGAGD